MCVWVRGGEAGVCAYMRTLQKYEGSATIADTSLLDVEERGTAWFVAQVYQISNIVITVDGRTRRYDIPISAIVAFVAALVWFIMCLGIAGLLWKRYARHKIHQSASVAVHSDDGRDDGRDDSESGDDDGYERRPTKR